MRNARHVSNRENFEARILDSTDSGFTTATCALDADIYLAHTEVESLVGSDFSGELGSERSALAGALETGVTRRTPSNHVATSIGDRNDCIVEGSEHAGDALDVNALLALLDLFFCSSSDRSFGSGSSFLNFFFSHDESPYFFLLATVFLGPLRVRALVRER